MGLFIGSFVGLFIGSVIRLVMKCLKFKSGTNHNGSNCHSILKSNTNLSTGEVVAINCVRLPCEVLQAVCWSPINKIVKYWKHRCILYNGRQFVHFYHQTNTKLILLKNCLSISYCLNQLDCQQYTFGMSSMFPYTIIALIFVHPHHIIVLTS